MSGAATEGLLESIATREGYSVLEGGKYGSNNGFDLVLTSRDGSVTLLMDGKQISESGAFSLGYGAKGNIQLSEKWIDAVLSKLDKTSDAYKAVYDAVNNGSLKTVVSGVDRNTGQVIAIPVIVPPKLSPGVP